MLSYPGGRGVPTLDGGYLPWQGGRGTYLGHGEPTLAQGGGGLPTLGYPPPDLAGGYLAWPGGIPWVPTPSHPDLAGVEEDTYLGWGGPTLGYPPSWPGQGVPTLAGGTYLGQGGTYLGVPTFGYPPSSGPGRGTPCRPGVDTLKTLPSPILLMRSVI